MSKDCIFFSVCVIRFSMWHITGSQSMVDAYMKGLRVEALGPSGLKVEAEYLTIKKYVTQEQPLHLTEL